MPATSWAPLGRRAAAEPSLVRSSRPRRVRRMPLPAFATSFSGPWKRVWGIKVARRIGPAWPCRSVRTCLQTQGQNSCTPKVEPSRTTFPINLPRIPHEVSDDRLQVSFLAGTTARHPQRPGARALEAALLGAADGARQLRELPRGCLTGWFEHM